MVTSLECGGLVDIPDPDPQWIWIPTLDTKQLLSKFYVLLVWWGGDRGSAVGWSSCSVCFVSQVRNLFPL